MKKIALLLAVLLFLPSLGEAGPIQEKLRGVISMKNAVADTTPPTLSTVTIGTDGDTWTFAYSETVVCSPTSDCCDAYAVTMSTAGAITLTYASGSGSNSVVCTGDITVLADETVTAGLDYTQPGNGIEDSAGNDLANIDDKAVTNNSTQEVESCDIVNIVDSQTGGLTNYNDFGISLADVLDGSEFTTSKAYSLCQYKAIIKKVDGAGTEPGAISIVIYASDGQADPKPTGAVLGTSSDSIAWATVTDSCVEYTWNFSTPVALSSGGKYWALYSVATAGSVTDYYRDCNYDTGAPSHWGQDESGIPSWTNIGHAQTRFKTYEFK